MQEFDFGDPKPLPREKKDRSGIDTSKINTYSCIYCHEKYKMSVQRYGVRSMTGLKQCCEKLECMEEAAKKVLKKQREADKKAQRKAWEKKKAQWEEELSEGGSKKFASRKKGAPADPLQTSINRIIKLIDVDRTCIARPFLNTNQYDSGHVFSIGSWPSLRYNCWNIFKQSVYSNRDKGGEQGKMLDGVEALYGKKDYVMSLREQYPELHLKDYEKMEALKKANKIIREWDPENPLNRDQVNEILGIYK